MVSLAKYSGLVVEDEVGSRVHDPREAVHGGPDRVRRPDRIAVSSRRGLPTCPTP